MRGRKQILNLLRNAVDTPGGPPTLLNILQSEISHELSSPAFKNGQSGPPSGFILEWDAPHSMDIFLRKKFENGEEVVVSALLGSNDMFSITYPKNVEMKVCIRKPGLASLLLFDCNVLMTSESLSECYSYITSAQYLQPNSLVDPRLYTGPLYSDLDPDLQTAFHDYLEARLGGSLVHFLIDHMHKKEQNQYVNWLQRLKERVYQSESSSPSTASC